MNRARSSFRVLLLVAAIFSTNRITSSLISASAPVASESLDAIPVTMTGAGIPQARILLKPNILSAATVAGLNTPAQTFNVWNSGGGTLSYSISADQSWLFCYPALGTSAGEHDSVTVSYSTATLSPGTYSAAITINDSAADNSPQTIPVSMTVADFPKASMDLDFEEGDGTTAYDTSANRNNGTLDGGAVFTKDRAVGSYALSFDGVDDRVVCPGNSSVRPNDISVSLWVNHAIDTSSPNYGGIIQGAFGNGYHNGFRILDYWNKPCAQINFGDARPLAVIGAAFMMNEWSHVVLTYDHKRMRLYQNGQLVVERPETRNINWAPDAGDLIIGEAQWRFYGRIDKVMIFSSALTAQQVQLLYNDVWSPSNMNLRTIRQPRSPSESRQRAPLARSSPPETGISWSPSILSAYTMAGSNAPYQSFDVWDSEEGTLSYSITVDQSWLHCFPESGTTSSEHAAITVSYATASLSYGTYSATITISDPGADHSPQSFPVSLTVSSIPQAIMELDFEEGEGTIAYDSSGNNNNGILDGGCVYTTDRAVGLHALSLDGMDDLVLCRGNLPLRPEDITVAL